MSAGKMIVIVPVPLLDSSETLDIFTVHSLPIPYQSKDLKNNQPSMVATYELQATALAVNRRRTKYVLLSEDEARGCSKPLIPFCSIRSPIFPINLSKLCLIALFTKNSAKIKTNCQTIIRTDFSLPSAEHISNGQWVITTNQNLIFTILCPRGSSEISEIHVKPPVGQLRLPVACGATNDYLTIMPRYSEESTYDLVEPINTFLAEFNSTQVFFWTPVHKAYIRHGSITIPDKLAGMKQFKMNKLVKELESLQQVSDSTSFPVWAIAFIAMGTVILLIVLYALYQGGAFKRLQALVRGAESGADLPREEFEMVPITLEVSGNNLGGVVSKSPSAPKIEAGQLDVGSKVYPNLNTAILS